MTRATGVIAEPRIATHASATRTILRRNYPDKGCRLRKPGQASHDDYLRMHGLNLFVINERPRQIRVRAVQGCTSRCAYNEAMATLQQGEFNLSILEVFNFADS